MQRGSFVKISNNRVFRIVDNIDEVEKLLASINKLDKNLQSNIVGTKVVSIKSKILEHSLISPIIHSGEYTESMVYDLTKLTFDLIFKMLEMGIYSFDLLPHNFTYSNGNWVLFDFGAFEVTPQNVKTQIRAMFTINFPAFELLKITHRKELKHFFLNRIKPNKLKKMLNTTNFLKIFFNSKICLFLCDLKLYKQAYLYLQKVFDKYYAEYNKKTKQTFKINNDKTLFNIIDSILSEHSIKNCFGTGETFANWSLSSNLPINKFAYIDDYDICDAFYNHIYQNKINNISTAVIAPLLEDEDIPSEQSHRALYDCFAQSRFISDAVIIPNLSQMLTSKTFDYSTFSKNIVRFSKKLLLIKFENDVSIDLEILMTELNKVYNNVELITRDEFKFLLCTSPSEWRYDIPPSLLYQNDNRGKEKTQQSEKIIEILQTHNNSY